MARLHWTRWEQDHLGALRLVRRPLRVESEPARVTLAHVVVGALAASLWLWVSFEIALGIFGGVL